MTNATGTDICRETQTHQFLSTVVIDKSCCVLNRISIPKVAARKTHKDAMYDAIYDEKYDNMYVGKMGSKNNVK